MAAETAQKICCILKFQLRHGESLSELFFFYYLFLKREVIQLLKIQKRRKRHAESQRDFMKIHCAGIFCSTVDDIIN